ncbi:MAG: methionyl-tRNA formyltransferase [Longimicrobiales bacterium]
MRILFWGTPAFAVPSLRAVYEEGHDIVGVVTQPDRPAGRGRALRPSAVKALAEAESMPVLQPERPAGDDFEGRVRELAPDVSVVVAYGRILRRSVLDLAPMGSLNVHASLLPELRGAAPINWAIVRGYEHTGVTIMRMVEELDAGPILYQVEEPILPDETASELTARLAEVGAEALVAALALLEVDGLEQREQDGGRATYAPRIVRQTARVDWNAPATEVARHVRGMDAVPGAWTCLAGTEIKLFCPVALDGEADGQPGVVLSAAAGQDRGVVVACGRGAVRIGQVKPAGKRRMDVDDWIRGRGVAEGDRFE